MKKVFLILYILIIICLCVVIVKNKKTKENPQDFEQFTGKIIVYFKNIETGELGKEYRNVSMERIKENMEQTILEELLKGPSEDELVTTIPNRHKAFISNNRGRFSKSRFVKRICRKSKRRN